MIHIDDLSGYPFGASDLYSVCEKYAARLVKSAEMVQLDFEPTETSRTVIRQLMDKSLQKARRQGLYRRVAAIVAVSVILFGTIMVTNVHAREVVVRWLRQIFPDHVLYQFFGEPEVDSHQYMIGWVPDGFDLIEQFDFDGYRMYSYESENESFSVSFATIEDGFNIDIGDAAYEMQEVFINGLSAMLFIDLDDDSKNLIWISQDGNIEIDMAGNISEDILIRIAESIK